MHRAFSTSPFSLFSTVAIAFVGITVLSGCNPSGGEASKPGTSANADAVGIFYNGTISLQTGDKSGYAERELKKLVQVAPQEPAGWANLALLQIRAGDLINAEENLQNAIQRDPKKDNVGTSRLLALEGLLAKQQGKFDAAVAKFKAASALDPTNLRALYQIKEVVEQSGDKDADKMVADLMTQILKADPRNLEALLEKCRASAKLGDGATVRGLVPQIAALSTNWTPEPKQRLKDLQAAVQSTNIRLAATKVIFLRNTLAAVPEYRAAKESLLEPYDLTGTPLEKPLVLPTPSAQPAPPDNTLTYTNTPMLSGKASLVYTIALNEKEKPAVFVVDGQTIRRTDKPNAKPLPFPGKSGSSAGIHALAALDIDNDLRGDIVAAGAGGVRLYKQSASGDFDDVTAKTKLPAFIMNGSYTGAWAFDVEGDGDMDILLGSSTGSPTVLRNNGDGSFAVVHPFAGLNGIKAFAWADFGGNGVPDAAFIDGSGKLAVYTNERSGLFRRRPVDEKIGTLADIAVMDVNNNGLFDIVLLDVGGNVSFLEDTGDGQTFKPLASLFQSSIKGGSGRLFVGDLDNNGALDLVVTSDSATEIRLNDGTGKFANLLPNAPKIAVTGVADLDGDGLLDLVGLANGVPTAATGKSTRNYNWQNITLIPQNRTPQVRGNPQRINSFAIGGEIDIRARLLYAKQPIVSPQTHFGLGKEKSIGIARIVWPTGNPQSEFDIKPNSVFVADQRLGGSCPFLWAWDGTKMAFVTDCIWRSPLGLKINAQATADSMQTHDWVKISGDQLKPRNGFYDLTITAELRETHFFDQLALMTVDHPAGTEIWVDERFAFPQPALRLYATTPIKPFAQIKDDTGHDVSDIVHERDGRYLDNFGRGEYQGVTRDHFVEFALPDDAPTDKPLYLVAFGWVHPTDTSVNVAMGQNPSAPKPNGLRLESLGADGKWRVMKKDLGFPEGKVKTILIRLDKSVRKGGTRRFRLGTNLEVFWDRLAWAEQLPDMPIHTHPLNAQSANLRYRGFSVVKPRDVSSPELPVRFDSLSGTAAQWRDLEGYHTRFGDVKLLLANIDDRYVIMNAGDAIDLRFRVTDNPPPGWKRDYVLIGDGWVKDGNINTTFGKTVLPLPAHDLPHYNTPPSRLGNDPVYKRHADDWQVYHTRYIHNDRFSRELRAGLH